MAEYTYKDVIIDPEDPRVEIGKEYWFGSGPKQVIDKANGDNSTSMLREIRPNLERPFLFSSDMNSDIGMAPCMIRKKETEKKYVPFDLNNPEDRKALMGKTIKANNRPFSRQYVELVISCFELVDEGAEGVSGYWMANGIKEDELFHNWTFLDGSPCGKEIEE